MCKKLLSICLLFLVAITAGAQTEFTVGNFKYTVTNEENKTVSIAKADEATLTGALVIPSSVTYEAVTYAVTSVGDSGFNGTGITSVTIPASVLTIGVAAFQSCGSLASITIEDSETPLTMSGSWYERPFWSPATTIYIGRNLTLTGEGVNPLTYDATSVEFGPQVTTINPALFYSNSKLASIIIGNGVTTIGESAFLACGQSDEVTETVVTMGSNVTSIGTNAFKDCTHIKSVTLPSKLTTIGNEAFNGSSLTSITIPASVMTIGDAAFQGCGSLASITIEDSETPLTMPGSWYERPFWSPATTIYIGRNLTLTGEGVNPLTYDVTSVEFGPQVTTINPALFYDNNNLASITIGSGVTTIGDNAFYSCGDAEEVSETVVSMGSNVTSIGINAFQYCSHLKSITLPSTLTTIGNEAFRYTGLTSISIPASVTSIGVAEFQDCGSMTSITIEDGETPLTMPGSWYERPFWITASTIYIGRDLTLTGEGNNPLLYEATSVEFGPKVTTINPNLFQGCASLSNINMTNATSLISIGAYAFDGAGNGDSVDELTVTLGSSLTTIGERAFNNCDKINTITIPASVTTIEANAFWNMEGDLNLTIEDSETPLTINAEDSYCPIFEYKNITGYIGRNILRTGNYEDEPVFNTSSSYQHNLTFGPMVTAIGEKEYYDCDALRTVSGMSNVVSIGQEAFKTCSNLTSVELGTKLTTMGDYAFQECEKLESIVIPGTLKKIPTEAFENCFALASVTLSDGVEEIGNGAFYDTDSLTEITIPASVKKVGRAPFYCNHAQAMKRMIIADSDEPLEFANGKSEYNWGRDNITDDITLDYFYLGRDVTRERNDQSLVYDAKEIEIGPKVTTISDTNGLFYKTEKITSIKVHALTPFAINDDDFYESANIYTDATLQVPGGTKEAYAAADGWKKFTNIDHWSTLVTLTATDHGSIATAEATATNGSEEYRQPKEDSVVYTLTADEGYELKALTDNDEPVSPLPALGEAQTRANASGEEFVKLNATFTTISYTISYELAGGSVASANPTNYTIESAAITLNNPTREGYTFAGWKLNGEGDAMMEVTIAQGSTGNKTYIATWTPIIYNIALTLDGGAADNPDTYTIESTAITLNNPTKTGYEFAGWKLNGEGEPQMSVTITAGSTGNVAYTATWTPVSYTISYELAGGSVASANPTSYNIESAPIKLNNPTKEHYDFAGWTGTGLDAATKDVTIATGSTGNRSYTATWTKSVYSVSIAGGGVTADNMNPQYGDNVVLTIMDDADAKLASLTVNGDNVTNEIDGNQYTITGVSGNVSVVAEWTSTKEFITMAHDVATFSCDKDLDFSDVSGLKAYIASGYDRATGTVLLTRVKSVPAETGLLLVGTEGETYKVPYETSTSFFVNLLQPVLSAQVVAETEGKYTNFLYGEKDEVKGFYKSSGSGLVSAKKAYLQLPTAALGEGGSVRVAILFDDADEDDATAIKNLQMVGDDEAVYNLNGIRVADKRNMKSLPRGIYIVGGRKIILK